jgi:CubicO group peptidase (beta-lactamase class C family)
MSNTQFKPIAEEFLKQLPSFMEAAGVPGLSIALIEDGKITWTQAFGVKEMGKPDPVTTNTLFSAGSLSKPLFAFAVLQLVDSGQLDLDRSLASYLPDVYIPGEPLASSISARHVLSHTSGLQNWRQDENDPLKIGFQPGTQFSYSGEGYFYLQRVVEKTTGQPFEAWMQSQVLQPFKMSASSYIWRPGFEEKISFGHVDHGQPIESWSARMGRQMVEVARKWNLPLEQWRFEDVIRALPEMQPALDSLPSSKIPNAASSLVTTPADFAGFLAHVLSRAENGGDSIQSFLKPQITLNRFLSWGLGWSLESIDGSRCIWHSGNTGISQCFAMGSVETQSGLVVMTNSDGGFKICQLLVNESAGRITYPLLWQ